MCHFLPGAHICHALIGACNPILCPHSESNTVPAFRLRALRRQAYGRHVVASAEIAAVNQVRASDDYATGVKLQDQDPHNANLYIGVSSMIAAALGLAPSKDVFWSNSSETYVNLLLLLLGLCFPP